MPSMTTPPFTGHSSQLVATECGWILPPPGPSSGLRPCGRPPKGRWLRAPSPPFHDGVRRSSERPTDPCRRRLRTNPSCVNAFQVAPRAETRDVLRRVVAPSRAKSEVMGRDVATVADRALAPIAVTFVDGDVRHGLAPRPPRFDERCAEKPEEGRPGGGRP